MGLLRWANCKNSSVGLYFLISSFLGSKRNKSTFDELLQILPFALLLFLPDTDDNKINFIEPFNIPSERKAIIQFANLITLGEKNINELRSLILELLKTEGSKINLQEILHKFDIYLD